MQDRARAKCVRFRIRFCALDVPRDMKWDGADHDALVVSGDVLLAFVAVLTGISKGTARMPSAPAYKQ